MSNTRTSAEISFKLLDKVGLIAVTPSGWNKELNIVSWNGAAAKYDIRDWSPEHDRMSKGMTLREEELQGLHKLLLQKYGTKPVVEDNSGEEAGEDIVCDENGEVIS